MVDVPIFYHSGGIPLRTTPYCRRFPTFKEMGPKLLISMYRVQIQKEIKPARTVLLCSEWREYATGGQHEKRTAIVPRSLPGLGR